MKFKTSGSILFVLALVLSLSVSARPDGHDRDNDDKNSNKDQECRTSDHHDFDEKTPVSIAGVIQIPGNPITGTDIGFVDSVSERYFIADKGNGGVDILDAENDVWVTRATAGFISGTATTGGGTVTSNGSGPNGILVTPNQHLWAGDGNSTAQVIDVSTDPSHSATYLQPLVAGGISTAWNASTADTCDGGTATTHFCGRADELAFDPKDHVIMIANNAPLSATLICPTTANPLAHCAIDTYATFINADSPYNVLGHISFAGAGGLEQTLWDPERQRFIANVPGKLNTAGTAVVTYPSIQVINPVTMLAEVIYPLSGTQDCNTITGGLTSDVAGTGMAGIALAPYQHILASACGFPLILTLEPSKVIPNTNGTIHVVNLVTQVGGGDELSYNPGDGRYYVAGPLKGVTGGVQQLGVIDAEDGGFLQNVSEFATVASQGRDPVPFPEQNRIFAVVQISAAVVAGTTPENNVCTQFNVLKRGCVVVFSHESH